MSRRVTQKTGAYEEKPSLNFGFFSEVGRKRPHEAVRIHRSDQVRREKRTVLQSSWAASREVRAQVFANAVRAASVNKLGTNMAGSRQDTGSRLECWEAETNRMHLDPTPRHIRKDVRMVWDLAK